MSTILIVAAVVGTLLAVGWFFLARRVPENAASHERPGQYDRSTTSDKLYAGSDRPAGPDAEVTDPAGLGGDQSPPQPTQ